MQKYKGRLVIRLTSRIDPVSVCKIDQGFKTADFLLLLLLLHIPEHRSEVCSSPPLYGDIFAVFFPFFFRMDHFYILDTAVTLDQIDFHFMEKILFFTENGIRFSKESPHSLSITGTGSINGDHQLLKTVHFLIFQRLDQRKISIMFHSVIIKNIIKTLRIQFHFLPQYGKLAEKFFVIVSSGSYGACIFPLVPFLASPSFPVILAVCGSIGKKSVPFFSCLFPFFSCAIIPECVIIKMKSFFQLFQMKWKGLFFQFPTDLFCGIRAVSKNMKDFFPDFFCISTGLQNRDLFSGNDLFHSNITG